MNMIVPPKLKIGDEIRVIAPAQTLSIVSTDVIQNAIRTLSSHGFRVTFSKYAFEIDNLLNNASRFHRIQDINDAFADENVKCILTAIGGYSSIDVIDKIDYELIKKHPKIFCGFSDVTIIENAITSQTGLITYYGPHFSSFGMLKGLNYTEVNFINMLTGCVRVHKIHPSKYCSDDAWFIDQINRKFVMNNGFVTINKGEAYGTIIGGNTASLCTLAATKYAPDFSNKIIFLEDVCEDQNAFYRMLDMRLETIILNPTFKNVKGIVIGRLPLALQNPIENIIKIVNSKKALNNIPILYGVDFGHTTPIITIPIGGLCHMTCDIHSASLTISEYPIK